jgi:hypothetical protein
MGLRVPSRYAGGVTGAIEIRQKRKPEIRAFERCGRARRAAVLAKILREIMRGSVQDRFRIEVVRVVAVDCVDDLVSAIRELCAYSRIKRPMESGGVKQNQNVQG